MVKCCSETVYAHSGIMGNLFLLCSTASVFTMAIGEIIFQCVDVCEMWGRAGFYTLQITPVKWHSG